MIVERCLNISILISSYFSLRSHILIFVLIARSPMFPKFLISLLLCLASVFLCSCATGKRALNSGNFTKATHLAANHLSNHEKSKNAQEVLSTAYPLAKSDWIAKASAAEQATHPFHWENAVVAYGSLNQLADSIESSVGANRLNLKVVRFPEEFEISKEKASVDREVAGDEMMEFGGRYQARVAFDHYERALSFKPESPVLKSKLLDALDVGTIRLALDPDLGRPFGVDSYELMDGLRWELRDRRLGKFVEFVPYDVVDYQGELREPHHILTVSVQRWSIGRASEYSNSKIITREIEVGKSKEDPAKPILKEVSATVDTFEHIKESNGTLYLTVYDLGMETVVFSTPIHESISWTDYHNHVSGDRRALKGGKPRYSEREPSPPSDYMQESDLMDRLARKAKRELNYFYEGF